MQGLAERSPRTLGQRSLLLLLSAVAACSEPTTAVDRPTGSGSTTAPPTSSSSTGGPSIGCRGTLDAEPIAEAQMPSSMAAVLCIAQETCCPGEPSSSSCRHGLNMHFEDLAQRSRELGLTYDGDCVGRQQAMVGAIACDTSSPGELPDAEACSIYFGQRSVGEPCQLIARQASDCAQGLACQGGTCIDSCASESGPRTTVYGYPCRSGTVPAGDDCAPPSSLDEPCDPACAEGLYCAPIANCGFECPELCHLQSAADQPCEQHAACRAGTCQEGSCVEGPSLDQPCSEACAPPHHCDADTGRCGAVPVVCTGLRL